MQASAKKYIGVKYIQHNPNVPNDAAAFYNYFEGYFKNNPKSLVVIHQMLADSDWAAIHLNSKNDQQVPEKTVNGNTLFDGENEK